jgi:hypothetical protein
MATRQYDMLPSVVTTGVRANHKIGNLRERPPMDLDILIKNVAVGDQLEFWPLSFGRLLA